MANEGANENDIGVRIAVLFIPVTVAALLLSAWLPRPVAWAGSAFAGLLLIYSFPSKANISLRRWLIIASLSSALIFCIGLVAPELL